MTFADEIQALGKHQGVLHVRLSNQLIYLLSEQMYSSPIKAIEELVVNAYDADATTCRIGFVDKVKGSDSAIVIYDDGSGMDYAGLEQLWHVGESPKVVQDTTPRRNRRVIGKFGIGKLATYAIANKITYVSHHENGMFHVSCDFRHFRSSPEGGAVEPVRLDVRQIPDSKVLRTSEEFRTLCAALQMEPEELTDGQGQSWTICVLEALNPDYSWDMLIRASNPAFSCGRSPVSLEPLSIRLNRLENRTIEPVIKPFNGQGDRHPPTG